MVQQNILNPILERRGLETKGPDFAEEKFQFEMSPSQKKVLGLKTADIKAVTFDKPEFDMFVDLFSQTYLRTGFRTQAYCIFSPMFSGSRYGVL